MNYKDTLDYLYSALPMFSRIGGAAIKKDLTNTRILCDRIGNPQTQFKSLHIAGTNGKGSVSHMLASILQQAGYVVGLYTSPHLKDFRERIKINGALISEETVIAFVEKMKKDIAEVQPSFFEMTVAMAFEYFASCKVDIAVIETGLGGRLDSTNIIHPELSVITNIGMDHMDILGDTTEKIAAEKAGIIKFETPVVIGETQTDSQPVFIEKAAIENAPIVFADRERYVDNWTYTHHGLILEVVKVHNNEKINYTLDLNGVYQTKNLLTTLAAVDLLRSKNWQIHDRSIQEGLQRVKRNTGLHGRWEVVKQHPAVVLDVGHNEDGIRQVCNQLEWMTYHHLHIVIGMVKDKDIEKVLKILPGEATYYFTRAQIPRALPEQELMARAGAYGLAGKRFSRVNDALAAALQHCHSDDLVVVCGSVFVVGEVDLDLVKNM